MESVDDLPRKRKTREKLLANVSSRSKYLSENNFTPPEQRSNAKDDSMSIQDVKETKAGSRYSLRSKLKRPINASVADLSRTPLTKKPAKGSKHTSAVNLTQESERPRDEHFTSEVALNIDLVVISLFRYMNCATLKSCRLVCMRWKYFGAKELQRRSEVTIQLSFGYVIDRSKNSVRSLFSVMQNSDLNTFPCASFDILTEELSSPRISNFFRVGNARNPIKKLFLTLNYGKKKHPWKESTLLEDLLDLLFRQAPNLGDLEIRFCLPSHWAHGLNTSDSGFLYPENPPYLLPKLTSLNLSGLLIPNKLFEDVMDAAVNLQSYEGCHFSPKMLKYFVDGNGRHRIHLLKHLRFLLYGAFVEVMERLVSQHGDDLKLESFYFVNSLTGLNGGAEFWSRASSIINQLFISSASTLERMGITPMRFLPGLAIFQLPNLSFIYFAGFFAENNDISHNFFFPSGFSLFKNFPNLRTVSFVSGSPLKSLEMLSITEPVTSVNHIWIKGKHGIGDETRARLCAAFPFVVLIEEGM